MVGSARLFRAAKKNQLKTLLAQDDALYCVPQSDISGMDGQAWTKEGTSPIKGPTKSCHLFPSSQTDVDLSSSQMQASPRANLEHLLSRGKNPDPERRNHAPQRKIP